MSETTIDKPLRTEVIQLGLEDIKQAQRLHFWQFVRSRSGMIRIAVSCVRATALFALVVLMLGKGRNVTSLILFFALASPFIVMACCVAVIFFLGKRLARKALDQQKTLQIASQKELKVSLNTAYKTLADNQERFVSIAMNQSHMIRKPLANILGLAQLLNDEDASGELKKLLNMLLISVEELDTMIKLANKSTIFK